MSLPKAKKSFGQNFLVDQSVVKKIIQAAEIMNGERVLEIGPGTGNLTEALLEAGANLTAIEADKDLLPGLGERFQDALHLVNDDALQTDLSALGFEEGKYKLIANIPYNITSALLERFLTLSPRPSRMVLMVQKEVGERLTAKPTDMSLLSVAAQTYAVVKRVTRVPAGAFRPAPKVDSAVVQLDLFHPAPPHAEETIGLAKAAFSARRKQLHGNLATQGIAPSLKTKAALRSLGFPETARAETLLAEQWEELRLLLGK